MKHWIAMGIPLFCCFCLMWVYVGQTYAAVDPDPEIQRNLQQLFDNPSQVQGYPYQQELAQAAKRYGLPLAFVLAVARGESFFDPKAKSAKGAIGIMQVMPSTAAEYGYEINDLYDVGKNIDIGVHHLSDLLDQLQDPYLALAAYYCGCGGVDNGNFTLRKDCDEYVRYINTHLSTILARAEAGIPAPQEKEKHFVLARFDNFLDAENFLEFLAEKLPNLRFDMDRREVVHADHVRYQYHIRAAYEQDSEKDAICSSVERTTGFCFCQ